MRRISLLLITVAFLSAMAVVFVRSANRQSFLVLQAAAVERDRLNEEWGRLQLEQATWSLHDLVEHEARHKLQMVTPAPDDVVILYLGLGS